MRVMNETPILKLNAFTRNANLAEIDYPQRRVCNSSPADLPTKSPNEARRGSGVLQDSFQVGQPGIEDFLALPCKYWRQ